MLEDDKYFFRSPIYEAASFCKYHSSLCRCWSSFIKVEEARFFWNTFPGNSNKLAKGSSWIVYLLHVFFYFFLYGWKQKMPTVSSVWCTELLSRLLYAVFDMMADIISVCGEMLILLPLCVYVCVCVFVCVCHHRWCVGEGCRRVCDLSRGAAARGHHSQTAVPLHLPQKVNDTQTHPPMRVHTLK